ncbi:MAG: class I SAM-dependent methyltransferase [Bacteroidales bacterium]|nr:class I SAM-dependent methyltransferase [Bacteroidales bacterium]
MKYDPIKKSLGKVFNKKPFLRKLFYKLLDILLLRTWHVKKELRSIRKELGRNANVLDAGAGFGQYVYYMSSAEKQWKITGMDIKEEQIEDCNIFFGKIGRATQVHFEMGDLTNLPKTKVYDLILCVDVMEHIEEDVKVFQNYASVLRDKGVLLISTPSDQGGSDVHDDHEESFIDEHVRDGYNIDEIKQKILSSGFSSIKARYSYGWPGKISWKLSMKIPISLLNISKLFFILIPFYYLITFPFCLLLNLIDVNGNFKTGTGLIVKAEK